jgi:hypothetical protein
MRRWSQVLVSLLAVVLPLGAAACGMGAASAGPNGETAEELLAQVFVSSYDLTAATATYDLSMELDLDLGDVPAEAQQIAQSLMSGMRMSGTFAYADQPLAMQYTVNLDFMGQNMATGLTILGDSAWVNYDGRWYTAPAELMQTTEAGTAQTEDAAQIQQLFLSLGMDPMTWLKGAKIAGEETLDGTAVIHVAVSPDVGKMFSDLVRLMQDPRFMALLSPGESLEAQQSLPTTEELAEAQAMMEDSFKDVAVDLWVGREDYIPRKVTLTGRMVVPAEAAAEGLNGADLSATILLANVNQVPFIQAPFLPQPYEALEQILAQDPYGPMGSFVEGFTQGLGVPDLGTSGQGYY